jgi:hypothetical protein
MTKFKYKNDDCYTVATVILIVVFVSLGLGIGYLVVTNV